MTLARMALLGLCVAFPVAAHLQELPVAGDENHAPVAETRSQRDDRMDWWRKAKFGMFIHYGLYSGLGGMFDGRPGGGEWIQCNLGLETQRYAEEALPRFRPAEDCAEEWAQLAEEAGCRYMVLTSKHHEGFALFDTETSSYNSQAQLGRDIVGEFVEAARRHGMRVGLYHSVIDWHQPDYDYTICRGLPYPEGQAASLEQKEIPRRHEEYQRYLHRQVRELMSRYGKIDVMWWDYSQGEAEGERAWKAPELMQMCRELQPGIIMNNRLYAFSGLKEQPEGFQLDLRCGDFTTPEKHIPVAGYPGVDWESCMTVGNHWGFSVLDSCFKSPAVVIRQLEECASKGGNFLLNVGPDAQGRVPEAIRRVFLSVGAWMRVNGESIYGSSPVETLHLPEGAMASRVGEDIYIFLPLGVREDYVLRIPAPDLDEVDPSVLGQPGVAIRKQRTEEAPDSGDDTRAYLEFIIPAAVWEQAVEGAPVLKLSRS